MKIKIAIIFVTAVISFLVWHLPYKETWSNRAFVFGQSEKTSLGYTSLKDDFHHTGSPERFIFLIVFFPVLLTSEILLADRMLSTNWRLVFVFQGLLGLFILFWAAVLMFLWDWFLFEPKAGYHIFLAWVMAYCILSILSGLPKLNKWILRAKNRLTEQWG